MNQNAQARCDIFPDALIFQLHTNRNLPYLPQLVVRIMAFFDGDHTLGEACRETQISVDQGLDIVKKLTEMDLLETCHEQEFAASMSEMVQAEPQQGLPVLEANHFSEAEEEFFAADISALDEDDYEDPYIPWREKMACFFSDLVFKLRGNTAL